MMAALLIVPPLLKYLAGPLAGPSALAGVALRAGRPLEVCDWNAAYLRCFATGQARVEGVVGDHTRDRGLDEGARAWWQAVGAAMATIPEGRTPGLDPVSAACIDFVSMEQTAQRLTRSATGSFLAALLPEDRPSWVGMSVLWSGQVYGALAATLMVKQRWPGIRVVWGGPHVTALLPEIAADTRYGAHIDGFVGGYAEETFADLLASGGASGRGLLQAGSGESTRALDRPGLSDFGDLSLYGMPSLILPAQASRGCAYGRCRFCTYPAIEGGYRRLSLDGLAHAVTCARRLGASVAVKDAFATPAVLDSVAGLVGGRVRWSACTRLAPRLGRQRLAALVDKGLATLEIGVESFDPTTLVTLDKRQHIGQLDGLLDDARGLDLHLVLNLMAGFPGQSADAAVASLEQVHALALRHPTTRFSTERNLLEIERRSPIAANPDRFGIRIEGAWPWSSVLDWNAPSWRRDLTAVWQTHNDEKAA